jgi:uncharacterized protein YecT (DUF1311 family)
MEVGARLWAAMVPAVSMVACGAGAHAKPPVPVQTIASAKEPTASAQPTTQTAGGLPSAAAPPSPCDFPESEEALLSCRHREQDRVEAAMAQLTQLLKQRYGKEPELLSAFTNAQAKWLEFRDAECQLRTYDSRGGTAFESYWLECLTELDQARLEVLQDMKDNP